MSLVGILVISRVLTLYVLTFVQMKAKVRDELKDSREDINVKRILVSEMCDPHRVDYFECLHGFKENVRMSKILNELEKQEYEAKHGPPPDSHH
jgi:hypothetical protein